MKSRKHIKTVLFVAAMLAVGTTMGAALLIDRQGGQTFGKREQSGGSVGRPTHAPTATSGIYGQAPDAPADAVALGNPHWSPPAFVPWPQGATGGGGAHGWTVTQQEWPDYYGSRTRDPGYSDTTYTVVNAGPDHTAVGRVAYNRGAESGPTMGGLFIAVPPSMSPAPSSSRDVVTVTAGPQITPAVPEPAEWTMLVAGLLLVGAIARRRQRNR
jgi:hypothetical protein